MTRPADRREDTRDGRVLFVTLAAVLARLNVLWTVIAPFVLTIPSSTAATALALLAASHTDALERRAANTAAAVSATVLVVSLGLCSRTPAQPTLVGLGRARLLALAVQDVDGDD